MKSILQKLYDGEIYPAEQIYLKTPEQLAKLHTYNCHHDEFSSKLKAVSPSLYEEFNQLSDEQNSTFSLELSETFISGFRLGVQMMIEVYQGDGVNTLLFSKQTKTPY